MEIVRFLRTEKIIQIEEKYSF